MPIEMQIKGLEKMARKLRAVTRTQVLIAALTAGAFHIQTWIVKNRLSGPRPVRLGRISSRLATSIAVVRGEKLGNQIIAKIGTNVEYARIHEFGGQAGRGLATTIPARPFLRPGIEDRNNKRFVLNLLINRIKRAVETQA